MFSSGSFITSTPIPKPHDSCFYENSHQSSDVSQASGKRKDLESSCLLLRKKLFGKRSISENIPDNQISLKHKLLLLKSLRGNSNGDTPRTSRNFAGSNKFGSFEENGIFSQSPGWVLNNTPPLKQVSDNDSGFCDQTPKRSSGLKSKFKGIPLLPLIENLYQRKENSKEESLAYFKQFLSASRANNWDNLSTSEMLDLYSIYRFQRTGLKPSIAEIAFYENQLKVKETNEEIEEFLSWKNKLERISSDLDIPKKIDFVNQLHKMNMHLVVSKILSYLSGYDLQNASCVGRLWRKLILEDTDANRTRRAYLEERRKLREAKEKKKLAKLFQRPSNFRTLESIGNIQKEELQFKKTVKEINFDAFIEVGKSAEKHKPMKCPSCGNLSLKNKKVITMYSCLFCNHEFCCNCLKPYTNWHICASTYLPAEKPSVNGKKYLRRL